MIRPVKKEDLNNLASIYKDLYDDVDIGEVWDIESATKLLEYWLEKQQDLFFVADINGNAVGAVMSGIKPWFDGNRLVDTEIFVAQEYQHQHLAKELWKTHLAEAKRLYQAKVIEFHTYGDETEFPQSWYNRIGFKKDKELIIMNANIQEVMQNLTKE